jgi:hypothetical protein
MPNAQTMTEDRISILKAEMDALKKERKEQARVLKESQKWVSVKKRLPENDNLRAVVWFDGRMERCWFYKGEWYVYDGTFFLTDKDVIDGVTHWAGTDWMVSNYSPAYGPGILNFLRYYWYNLTDKASDVAYDLRPRGWSKTAQLDKKPVFYRDSTGKLMTGLPENLPAPKGYEKLVCGSVQEAERYSEMQRRQERVEHRYQQEQKGSIEESQRDEIRSERREFIKNARNSVNRDFLIAANERFDKQQKPWQYERESFLHSEGYEDRR